jgi:hypothetical protein
VSRSFKLLGVIVAGSLTVGAYACGGGGDDSAGGSGGGGTGGSGATGASGGQSGVCQPGAPPECCAETRPVMQVRDSSFNLVAPDWSCIMGGATGGAGGAAGAAGAASGGAAGAAGAASGGAAGAAGAAGAPSTDNIFRLEDFSSNDPKPDIEVELFEGDSLFGATPFLDTFTKGPAHPGPTELNQGEFYFPHPASGVISYHVYAKGADAKEFAGFGYAVPAPPGKVTGNTLSESLFATIAGFAVPIPGWQLPADLAIVTGPIRDCKGDDVGGGTIKYFDDATGQELVPGEGERDVRYIYFDGEYPNPTCAYTDYRQSLWVVANAPSNAPGTPGAGHKYHVEYWGRLTDANAQPVKFAEKSLEVFAGTVNVHEIHPNVQQ